MLTRIAVASGWLVYMLRRGFGWLPVPPMTAIYALIGLLLALALLPIALGVAEPRPQEVGVEAILADQVTEPQGWVRLEGRIEPLPIEATLPGSYALLHDAEDPLLAVVLRSEEPLDDDRSQVIGHLAVQGVAVNGYEPVTEPGQAAGRQRVVADQIVEVDEEAVVARPVAWALVVPPLLGAGLLGLGLRTGYPAFRASREVDVLAQPLTPGERLPLILAGALGEHRVPLDEPADALLLVASGPRGGVLTIQLMPEGGGYVAPISVGPGWSRGQLGYVYTLREEVPALAVQAEGIDVILMFARITERNKAAALVPLEH